MEALLPEMALWEMHRGAKMVPFLLCFESLRWVSVWLKLGCAFRLSVSTSLDVGREYWVFYFALGQRATRHLLALLC